MSRRILVAKFGGTSVGTVERIQAVASTCVSMAQSESCRLVVVVSAMGDTTDDLISLMQQISSRARPSLQDFLLSTGEQVSVALLAMAIEQAGGSAEVFAGWQAGFATDERHTKARILDIDTTRVRQALNLGRIAVVAGFQGLSPDGCITTLGRGGSDTSAVALAVALNAECCHIFTDVDAVCTADPRIVKKIGRIEAITYDEMLELASLGAQVLHPRSVEIARNFCLPLRVRSSWNTSDPGTLVTMNTGESRLIEGRAVVRGVALDRKQARLSIIGVPDRPGIAHQIFSSLSEHGISVDIIVQCVSNDGATELDFTVDQDESATAKRILDEIASQVGAHRTHLDENVVKVSAVGAGMIDEPGIAARMFKSLGQAGINIQIISTSEIRISCIVATEEGERAVNVIHEEFELDKVTS